jgi:hypothetical protein
VDPVILLPVIAFPTMLEKKIRLVDIELVLSVDPVILKFDVIAFPVILEMMI